MSEEMKRTLATEGERMERVAATEGVQMERALATKVLDGQASRRDVMKRAGAIGLGAVALGHLLPAPGVMAQSDAEPGKPGGELSFSVPSAPLRIDPALAGSSTEYIITNACYNTLLRVNPAFELELELAEDWQVSEDGLTYTFKIHTGVKFHHGKELTSEDVAYTLNRIRDEATASNGRALFTPIEAIETPDPATVVFKLTVPFADLPYHLGSTFSRIIPSDVDLAGLNAAPVGTGPFRLDVYQPGSQIVLVKNPDYWEEGLPYLDKVSIIQIPEQTAQAAALAAGQTHIFHDVTPQTVGQLEDSADVTVVEIPSPSFQPICMRCDMAPFDKVEVRQALKYSVDREGIVQAVLLGHGTVANDHHVPPTSPFWADTGTKTRDIEKAKELLAQAGYGDGLDLELVASNERPGLVELATVVKQLAAEAGFRIELKIVPWDVFVAEHNETARFFATNWFGRASIDETLYPYLHTGANWNDEHYSNPEVDSLLEAGRATIDIEQRKELYAQVQQIVAEDGPALIPYHKTYITAHRNEVKGYQAHPLRFVDLRWTWLDV